jgi:hypothetical protein
LLRLNKKIFLAGCRETTACPAAPYLRSEFEVSFIHIRTH